MEGGNRGNAVAENFRRSAPKSGREEQAKAAVSDALFGREHIFNFPFGEKRHPVELKLNNDIAQKREALSVIYSVHLDTLFQNTKKMSHSYEQNELCFKIF